MVTLDPSWSLSTAWPLCLDWFHFRNLLLIWLLLFQPPTFCGVRPPLSTRILPLLSSFLKPVWSCSFPVSSLTWLPLVPGSSQSLMVKAFYSHGSFRTSLLHSHFWLLSTTLPTCQLLFKHARLLQASVFAGLILCLRMPFSTWRSHSSLSRPSLDITCVCTYIHRMIHWPHWRTRRFTICLQMCLMTQPHWPLGTINSW